MKLKRLFSMLICMTMLLPAAVLAKDSDIVLDEINLIGMTEPVKYNEVQKPTIREASGNSVFKVYSGEWYRTADDAIVYTGDTKFDSGTEYYYSFGMGVGVSYVISPECVFTIDGEKIPAENISYSQNYVHIKTKNYMTEGTPKKILEKITLYNAAQPAYNDSTSALLDKITVPEGAPYKIKPSWWGYKLPNGRTAFARSDFSKGSDYSLTLNLKLDDGYATSYTKTKVELPDSVGIPVATRVSGVLRHPDKENPCVVISYTVKQPESKIITLDANGGTFTNQSAASTELYTDNNGLITVLPDKTDQIYKRGYYLIGWYTQKTGGERVDTSKVYTANTTLYAHWGEIIDEVRLYTVMPLPDRNPVLFKLGNDEYSVSQYWQSTDSESLAFSDDEVINGEAGKQGILLMKYKKNKFYRYYAEITSDKDKHFTDETKVYLNNQKLENKLTYPSKRLTVSESYAAAERSFEVFGGGAVEIPAGICGSAIKQIDLNNYISSASGSYIVTPDSNFTAYGLHIDSNRYITGSYPNTETAEKTFTLTVKSGSNTSKTLTVRIGRAQRSAFIVSRTKAINVSCKTAGGAAIVNVCAPDGVTPQYTWQFLSDKTWYNIKDYLPILTGYSGYDNAVLVIQDNPKSVVLRCIITAGEKTIPTEPIEYNVEHNCKRYSKKDGTYHSQICDDCNSSFDDEHIYKYTFSSEPVGTEDGIYRRTCVRCGYGIGVAYQKKSGQTTPVHLSIINRETAEKSEMKTAYAYMKPMNYNPTRNGYTFLGWTVDKESQTPDYSPDEEIFVADVTLTLYAVWGQNVTAVSGKNINTQSTNDVFGDGSVLYTPQTARNKAVLTLNNAHIVSYPVTGVSYETGIYTNTDIEIMLEGDNVIETDNASAIGILSDGNVTFSGDGSLTVCAVGSGYYATGVKAKKIDVYSKKLYITDCKTGFYGKTALCDGVTEIYAKNYKSTGFKAFSQAFTEDSDAPMCVIGTTDVNNLAAKLDGAASAVNARYVLIVPENNPLIHYNADRKSIIPVCGQNGTLVFANYDESEKLTNTQTISQNFKNKERSVSELSNGDKIFLWESLDTLKPLCEAFSAE